MASTPRGTCLVCGTETANRCSRCLEAANIDLFFCSPGCQKLVWQGHKLFCGRNAFPLAFPLLTAEEARIAVRDLAKPLHKSDSTMSAVSPLEVGAALMASSKEDLELAIHALTEGSPFATQALYSDRADAVIALARVANISAARGTLRHDILWSLTEQRIELTDAGLLPAKLREATPVQTTLFHALLCFVTLARKGSDVADGAFRQHTMVLFTCMKAMFAYAAANISPAAAEWLSSSWTFEYDFRR